MKTASNKTHRITFRICWMVILVLGICGCAGSGKPPYYVEHYLLSYQAPAKTAQAPLPAALKFNRFSIAAAYNTANMIFRGDAQSIDSFNYSRWAVNPADMVADCLLRDLRATGYFQAVFARIDADEARFLISGGIEEFYLKIDGANKTAVVGLVVSLQDTRTPGSGKKLLFQKKYSREEPLQEASPRGYALAASLALQKLAGPIAQDLAAAIKTTAP